MNPKQEKRFWSADQKRFVYSLQPPRLEVAFCMYPRMHLIFIYCCVIILTIRVTGTDMNKNSCKAAESAINRTILRMAVAAGSLEKGRKDMEEMNFDDIVAKVKECGKKTVAVSVAQDSAVLEAVHEAKRLGIADAILVGDEAKIREIAAGLNMDLSDYEIINEPDMIEASLKAVKLAHDGRADMYMKGLIDSKNFLKSVLNKEVGLRTGGTLSHVCVFEIPGIDRLLFLTDVAFMTYPTLEEKVQIIKNTIPVCNACGVAEPKVAPLAAVEVVNPKMPVTVDAAELTKMCEEGQIPGCIVDGPLSLDLAIDPEAAKHKGATDRKIQGDADVLLFPDIHAGNLVYKAIVHMVKVKNGCILTGTKVPVVLTSRSDTFETKVYSLALAAVVAEEMKKNQK